MSKGSIQVPPERCRLLVDASDSHFSTARTYYVPWTIGERMLAEGVRPFAIHGSSKVMLVFANAEEAAACDAAVPAGLLLPIQAEHARMRVCSASKSLCPEINFPAHPSTGPPPASCAIHLPQRTSARVEIEHPVAAPCMPCLADPLPASSQTLECRQELDGLEPMIDLWNDGGGGGASWPLPNLLPHVENAAVPLAFSGIPLPSTARTTLPRASPIASKPSMGMKRARVQPGSPRRETGGTDVKPGEPEDQDLSFLMDSGEMLQLLSEKARAQPTYPLPPP